MGGVTKEAMGSMALIPGVIKIPYRGTVVWDSDAGIRIYMGIPRLR